MPRSFDLSTQYQATVEQLHRAFSDEHYWLARLTDSGADVATLDSMTVGVDGSIHVATTQVLRRDRLPALAAQFLPGDVHIVREEKWGPVSGGEAHAEIAGSIAGAPVSLSGKAVLAPTDAGSRLEFTVTIEVDVPLVGGKIETFIGGKLAELVTAEQRFTTGWMAENP
jgi:Protein of unknown function (DUF2505)